MRWKSVEFVSKNPDIKAWSVYSTLDGMFSISYSGPNSWLVKNNTGFRDDFIVSSLKEAKSKVLEKFSLVGWGLQYPLAWIPIRFQCGIWSIQRLKSGYSVYSQNKLLSNHSNLREAKNYVETKLYELAY